MIGPIGKFSKDKEPGVNKMTQISNTVMFWLASEHLSNHQKVGTSD